MKYNGWSNYATWRVNLEIVDDWASHTANDLRDDDSGRYADVCQLADAIEEMVDEVLTVYGEMVGECLALDYARAFVSDVNWDELAAAIVYDEPALWIVPEVDEYGEEWPHPQ